jgi:hypothetical protein
MLSLLAVAPYAAGLAFVSFVYFLAYPYLEYLRDPKGTWCPEPMTCDI